MTEPQLKLKRPLPAGRSYEQVKNHYLIEREIAAKLLRADREGRKRIYSTMYDDLFEKVPDHPRLTRRENPEETRAAFRSKLTVLDRFLTSTTSLVEFAPGDCRFAAAVCERVKTVYAIDISDQRGAAVGNPENLHFVVYDGYHLDLPAQVADVIFSDQLLEHFHPEDIQAHFDVARRLLKDGGRYLFRTPHRYTGPHDISQYFCDAPEGFHLREYSNTDLVSVLDKTGFSDWSGFWNGRGACVRLPKSYFLLIESALGKLPPRARRAAARLFLPGVVIEAIK